MATENIASGGRRVHNVITGGSETEPSPVEVEVRLPQGSSLAFTTSQALSVTGPLALLELTSRAGRVTAGAADTVDIITTDGQIEIGAILTKGKIFTENADIEIHAYQGSNLSVETRTDDIRLTATSTASGSAELTTIDGTITKDAKHLDIVAHSTNGVVHHR